jgi:hypothetical protein
MVPKLLSGGDNAALGTCGVQLKQWPNGPFYDRASSSLSKNIYAHNADGDPCVVRLFSKMHLLEHAKMKMVDSLVHNHKMVEGHPNILSLEQVPPKATIMQCSLCMFILTTPCLCVFKGDTH